MQMDLARRHSPSELARLLSVEPNTLLCQTTDGRLIFLGKLWTPEQLLGYPPAVNAGYPNVHQHLPQSLYAYLTSGRLAPHQQRAAYAKWLFDLRRADPRDPGAVWEDDLFQANLERDLAQRCYGAITHEFSNGIEHWRWVAPFRRDRSPNPAINYLGTSGVPVYRVLWPLHRPGEPIPFHKEPVRYLAVCPDAPYPCVEPLHFHVSYRQAAPARRMLKLQERHRADHVEVQSPTVRWKRNDRGIRVCERGSHPIDGRRYEDVPDEHMPRYVYCSGCYKDFKDDREPTRRRYEPTEQDRADLARLWAEHEAKQQAQLGGNDGYASDLDRPI